MRTNGTIRFLTNPNGGYKAPNGDWITQNPIWSDSIPCCVVGTRGRITKYQDGLQVAASFEILLDMREFDYSQIEVFQWGVSLGKYNVLRPNIQFLTSVGRIKITV